MVFARDSSEQQRSPPRPANPNGNKRRHQPLHSQSTARPAGPEPSTSRCTSLGLNHLTGRTQGNALGEVAIDTSAADAAIHRCKHRQPPVAVPQLSRSPARRTPPSTSGRTAFLLASRHWNRGDELESGGTTTAHWANSIKTVINNPAPGEHINSLENRRNPRPRQVADFVAYLRAFRDMCGHSHASAAMDTAARDRRGAHPEDILHVTPGPLRQLTSEW